MINGINIMPAINYNEEELKTLLNNISKELPDAVVESGYYIDGKKLIITKGNDGYAVQVLCSKDRVEQALCYVRGCRGSYTAPGEGYRAYSYGNVCVHEAALMYLMEDYLIAHRPGMRQICEESRFWGFISKDMSKTVQIRPFLTSKRFIWNQGLSVCQVVWRYLSRLAQGKCM